MLIFVFSGQSQFKIFDMNYRNFMILHKIMEGNGILSIALNYVYIFYDFMCALVNLGHFL